MLECWDDAAKLVDAKWERIYSVVIPEAQSNIAEIIGSSTPKQIVFAPNTHEFVLRLFSCLPPNSKPKVLTTDSEFYSFSRQVRRLEQENLVDVYTVPVQPIGTFEERFSEAISQNEFDMVYLSHVFFNSGLVVGDLESIVNSVSEKTIVVIDGYHHFCALPNRVGSVLDRAFYLSGGYKYAQSGEGACWLHVPPNCSLEPRNTGWFATFNELSGGQSDRVSYAPDGNRFAGATFDLAGIYRFNAVCQWMKENSISVELVHQHVQELQQHFIKHLENVEPCQLSQNNLLVHSIEMHGHFLTFELDSTEAASELRTRLADHRVIVDSRGNRIRFGFGLYQDISDVDRLFEILKQLNK